MAVNDDGSLRVPHPEALFEYVGVMAIGDTQSRPKGGFRECRDNPTYKTGFHGMTQGELFKNSKPQNNELFQKIQLRACSVKAATLAGSKPPHHGELQAGCWSRCQWRSNLPSSHV